MVTKRIRIYGIVQGVGFRPSVSRHAAEAGVTGSVCNKGSFVEVIAQGQPDAVEKFIFLIEKKPPKRAVILKMDVKEVDAPLFPTFEIATSAKKKGEIFVSPDIAICDECRAELLDPKNRRYLHPFINCTSCGPRLTILESLPYDRERTSMKEFPMCEKCRAEYTDPGSRRYDAQPVCCMDCGPEVYLIGRKERGRDAIIEARRTIIAGGIVAVKGVGGFHLCCDATSESAVRRLRKLKRRPAKPFAVMMRDQETVKRACLMSDAQREILTGHQKPILLLKKRESCGIAPSVAADNPALGVMLPYAPVQILLFTYNDGLDVPPALVMTSGNVSGAPICRDDEEALRELSSFTDVFLSHNRRINIRCDDSVMDFYRGQPYMVRRSRGYAPLPFLLTEPAPALSSEDGTEISQKDIGALPDQHEPHAPCVLGIGGELKNTFCFAKGNLYYPSSYIGDLSDARSGEALRETVARFARLLEAEPDLVVCDLHPRYRSSGIAQELAEKGGIPLVKVQHHYAHILSCMAENDFTGPVIGVSFDGTGYGTDGTIWGGEIMIADTHGFRRAGSIAPFLHAGGDAASREGWRIACSMLADLYPGEVSDTCSGGSDSDRQAAEKKSGMEDADRAANYAGQEAGRAGDIAERLGLCGAQQLRVIEIMREKHINTVMSTSCGRLFDAVSAILGIRKLSTYEGEAAMELMFAAQRYADTEIWRRARTDDHVFAAQRCTGNMSDIGPCDITAMDKFQYDGKSAGEFEPKLSSEGNSKHAEPVRDERNGENGRLIMRTDLLVKELAERRLAGEDTDYLAWLFHRRLADMTADAVRKIAGGELRTVCLTGGCFQNTLLLDMVQTALERDGFRVLVHSLVPPNDGGIALGQALYGEAWFKMTERET